MSEKRSKNSGEECHLGELADDWEDTELNSGCGVGIGGPPCGENTEDGGNGVSQNKSREHSRCGSRAKGSMIHCRWLGLEQSSVGNG